MRILLLKMLLWSFPLTPQSHKKIAPVMNGWVDKLNEIWWKPAVNPLKEIPLEK